MDGHLQMVIGFLPKLAETRLRSVVKQPWFVVRQTILIIIQLFNPGVAFGANIAPVFGLV